MKKVICIPTYNRAEAIEEFLVRYQDMYKELGFDIHIFDSSENEDTYIVVKSRQNNQNGLLYTRMDSSIHSNLKVYYIYRNYFISSNYDYIWVQSDSIRWNEEVLPEITRIINAGIYDVIVPNYRDVENIGNKEYVDKNSFFQDCAWHMTLYGATIINKKIFYHTRWDSILQKYGTEDTINFSHVGLYFEQIYYLDSFKAYHMSLDPYSLSSTMYKKDSGWRGITFYIMCESWPNVIEKLPKGYKNKDRVKLQSGINSGIFTHEGLRNLRKEGILNWEIVKKYANVWPAVSEISLFWVALYSLLPKFVFGRINSIGSKYEKKLIRKIKSFCRNYSTIYIYGAGQRAYYYKMYLDYLKIDCKAFIVSEKRTAKKNFLGKEVIIINDSILENKNNGILIALNNMNTSQVAASIKNKIINAGLFSEHDMPGICKGVVVNEFRIL